MSDKYHSVWQDEFTELWVVDRCDEQDNSNTVRVFEHEEQAREFAKELSAKTGLPIRENPNQFVADLVYGAPAAVLDDLLGGMRNSPLMQMAIETVKFSRINAPNSFDMPGDVEIIVRPHGSRTHDPMAIASLIQGMFSNLSRPEHNPIHKRMNHSRAEIRRRLGASTYRQMAKTARA